MCFVAVVVVGDVAVVVDDVVVVVVDVDVASHFALFGLHCPATCIANFNSLFVTGSNN